MMATIVWSNADAIGAYLDLKLLLQEHPDHKVVVLVDDDGEISFELGGEDPDSWVLESEGEDPDGE